MIKINVSEPNFDTTLDIANKLVSKGIVEREVILSIEDDLVEIERDWDTDNFIETLKTELSDFAGLSFEKVESESVDFNQEGKPIIPNPIENITYTDVPDKSTVNNAGELAADSISSSVSVDMFSKLNNNTINNMKLKDKSKRSFNDSLENENTEMATVETVTEADQEQTKKAQLDDTANVNGNGLSEVSGQVEDVVVAFSKAKRNTRAYSSALRSLRRIFTENQDLAQDALDVINDEYDIEPEGDPAVENLGEFAKRIKASKSTKTSKFSKYRKAEPKRLFADEYGDEAAENYIADVEAVVSEYPDIQGEVVDFVKKKFNLEEAGIEDESDYEPVTPFTEEEIGEPEVTESDDVVEKPVEFSRKFKRKAKNVGFSRTRRKFDDESEDQPAAEPEDEPVNVEDLMFSDEETGEASSNDDNFDPNSVELFSEDELEGNDDDEDESEPAAEDNEDDDEPVDGEFSSKSRRGQFSRTNTTKSLTVAEFRQQELQAMLK